VNNPSWVACPEPLAFTDIIGEFTTDVSFACSVPFTLNGNCVEFDTRAGAAKAVRARGIKNVRAMANTSSFFMVPPILV
jgi:hypothetical protein